MEEKSMEQTQKGTGEDLEKEGRWRYRTEEDTDKNTEQVQGAGENVRPDNGMQNTSLKNTEEIQRQLN